MKRWLVACLGLFATGIFLAVIGYMVSGPDNRRAVFDKSSPVGQILPEGDDQVPAAQPPGAGEVDPTANKSDDRRIGEPASR